MDSPTTPPEWTPEQRAKLVEAAVILFDWAVTTPEWKAYQEARNKTTKETGESVTEEDA